MRSSFAYHIKVSTLILATGLMLAILNAQPDNHFTARIPDANRQTFSLGIAQMYQNWELETGYMYMPWDDRTLSNSTPPSVDPNGTLAFNGTYKSRAHLFGVGVSKKF